MADVLQRIGKPSGTGRGEFAAEEIWTYELGKHRERRYRYCVLVDTRTAKVAASWWASEPC
jgi:hypothetical protein